MKLAVLCVLLLAVVSHTVSAANQLCLSGDNEILKLFVDGNNLTPKLKFENKLTRCDCVDLPLDVGLIAIEAKNWKGLSSIQACNSGNPTLLEGWVCEPIRKFTKAKWTSPSYDDKKWRKTKRQTCKSFQRCDEARAKTLPCNPAKQKCFWSKMPGKIIRCRLKQCAATCTGCKSAGVGKCDSDKCKFGSAVSVVTGQPTCNRKCCLVVKTSGDPTVKKYMELTDSFTGQTSTYSTQADGRYLAMVDIDTCTFFKKEYRIEALEFDITILINNYKSSIYGEDYVNTIGIDTEHYTSRSHYTTIWRFGRDDANGIYFGGKTEMRLCLTGVKKGEPDITNFVQVPP